MTVIIRKYVTHTLFFLIKLEVDSSDCEVWCGEF